MYILGYINIYLCIILYKQNHTIHTINCFFHLIYCGNLSKPAHMNAGNIIYTVFSVFRFFQFFAVTKTATVNICINISLCSPLLIFCSSSTYPLRPPSFSPCLPIYLLQNSVRDVLDVDLCKFIMYL